MLDKELSASFVSKLEDMFVIRFSICHVCVFRVRAEVWNTEKLRKVSLSTDIPVRSYPHDSLTWHVHVVMGDIR